MMRVSLTGTGALDLSGEVKRDTSIDVIDDIMHQVSELLGDDWSAAKVSGYWLITRNGVPVAGDKLRGQRRVRDFGRALADGTGRAVIQDVPMPWKR